MFWRGGPASFPDRRVECPASCSLELNVQVSTNDNWANTTIRLTCYQARPRSATRQVRFLMSLIALAPVHVPARQCPQIHSIDRLKIDDNNVQWPDSNGVQAWAPSLWVLLCSGVLLQRIVSLRCLPAASVRHRLEMPSRVNTQSHNGRFATPEARPRPARPCSE